MAHLIADSQSPNPGQRYELSSQQCTLGRHPDCEIVVEVGAVSRYHARISQRGQSYYLNDLGSRNGTYVNGELVGEPHELQDGDKVRICDVTFNFRVEAPIPAESPSALVGPQTGGDLLTAGPRGPARTMDGDLPNVGVMMEEDEETSGSTIVNKFKVGQDGKGLTSSTESRLQALLEITRNLGNALALDDVLPKVLDSLFKILIQADRGFIVLKDPKTDALIPRWTKVRNESDDQSARISRTIVRKVMESKEALLSYDAATDSNIEMSESIAEFRIRSMMCSPLINAEGEAIGALQVLP